MHTPIKFSSFLVYVLGRWLTAQERFSCWRDPTQPIYFAVCWCQRFSYCKVFTKSSLRVSKICSRSTHIKVKTGSGSLTRFMTNTFRGGITVCQCCLFKSHHAQWQKKKERLVWQENLFLNGVIAKGNKVYFTYFYAFFISITREEHHPLEKTIKYDWEHFLMLKVDYYELILLLLRYCWAKCVAFPLWNCIPGNVF